MLRHYVWGIAIRQHLTEVPKRQGHLVRPRAEDLETPSHSKVSERPTRAHVARSRDAASLRHITLSEARSRLYRRRSLQVNSHFAALFKIYKIFTILRRSNLKMFVKVHQKICEIFFKITKLFTNFCKF